MSYHINQRNKIKRDWTVIFLLYFAVTMMGLAGYYAVQNYVNSGHAQKCEASRGNH